MHNEFVRVLNSLSDLNILRILNLIWRSKKISRTEIASILKMDKSTVTKIISRLKRKNLVQEAGFGESRPQGGRKTCFLEINGSFACVGGIHINTEQIIVCLADLRGTILFESVQKIDEDDYAKNGFSGILQDGIKLLQKNAERMRVPIAGIGLGVPGIVDIENKKIIQSIPLLIEKPFYIAQAASEILDVPFFLENDARCCCYAERIGNKLKPSKNFMYVFIEHRRLHPIKNSPKNISVGFGFASKEKIFHGANSCMGEFRSIFWSETSSSQFSLATQNIQNLESEEARKIFVELSKNVAFLANTLSLELVFVGGIEKHLSENLVNIIHKESERLWPYEWNKAKSIESANITTHAVSYGAMMMVLDKIFSVPDFPANENSFPMEGNSAHIFFA